MPRNNDKRGPLAWMAGNSVASNLIMITCLVGGFLSVGVIRQEVFPDFTIDKVMITVSYPGASPEEVEEGLVLPVEEAVEGLEGIDEITSTAAEGSATIVVEAMDGTDLQKLKDDIESEVDRIDTFPEDAEDPVVMVPSRKHQVLTLILYGDVDKSILKSLGDSFKDILLQDKDITQVEVSGLPPHEIRIEIDQETLRKYGLNAADLATRIRAAALDFPAGSIDASNGEIMIRIKEKREYGREFARLPIITTDNGTELTLGEAATVIDAFEDSDRYLLYDGKPAARIEVYRVGKQTPLSVAKAVREHLDELRAELPPGVELDTFHDMSDVYRQRAELMLRNGAMGLVLVLVLLGIFLEARLAFWVMMGIPVSFLGSLLLLPILGISINMISMFAYIIALGIVVDDAIVVGENTYSYIQEGMPPLEAAIKAVREVAVPVTFSVLTNIATFLPLAFIPGTMGKIFKVIPAVVVSTFVISLVECLVVLPAHLAHGGRPGRRGGIGAWLHGRQQAFSHAFSRWIRVQYGGFLDRILHHRWLTLSIAAAILVATIGYSLSGRLGMTTFPEVESDYAQCSIVFPYGTPVARTEEAARKAIVAARKVGADVGDDYIQSIMAEIGRNGSHTVDLYVLLPEAQIRDKRKLLGTDDFSLRWRDAVGQIPGTESVKFQAAGVGPRSGTPINVELSHRNIEVLEKAGEELAAVIQGYPMAREVDDGFQPGKQQFDIVMRPEGKSLGLTASAVGRQLRAAFHGAEAMTQVRGRNEVEINVVFPESRRDSPHFLETFMLQTPAGVFVPLEDVAEVALGRAYTTIDHRNGRRVVQVTADARPRSRAGEVLNDLKATVLPDLMRKYPGLSYSFQGREADMRESISALKLTFVLAMLAVYAMLAIPFGSYLQPLVVMASIPFGIVGAVLGHLLMGYSMSVISLFGVVALAGVVVNDSLILITFANRGTEEGKTPHDAMREGAIQRFRQIVLTSITTFGGLAPLIFEQSLQARIMIPMAISLGFGILFALLITLIIVPILYLAVEDAKAGMAKLLRTES